MQVRFGFGILFTALTMAATGCHAPLARTGAPISHNLPPSQMLMEPGPGVGGPGPGVMAPFAAGGGVAPASYQEGCGPMGPGAMGPMGPMGPGPMMGPGMAGAPVQTSTVQVEFGRPEAMQIRWDVTGQGQYDSDPLVVPGKQNFAHGGIYRLKISSIDGRQEQVFYPTLEVAPSSPRTLGYLAHTSIPVQFTEEDFDQATAGNFVTKVIYIPDPGYADLAVGGIETLVSTRLDPGVNPIEEADRRGAILAIVRMGNKDMEAPGTADASPVSYNAAGVAGGSGPAGFGPPAGQYISGMTGPNYGMPHVGTPIGLPGPPHIPLGGPAGLQNHMMYNHTATHIPAPTDKMNIHVQQVPGLSYPRPANKVMIREETIRPPHMNQQPPADMLHGVIPPGAVGGMVGDCQ